MSNRFRAGYQRCLAYLGLEDAPSNFTGPVGGPDHGERRDLPPHPGDHDADEHGAVLELLVATMYADATIVERELAEIDRYGEAQGWNTPAFSFTQAIGAATAKVRAARELGGGTDALLHDAAARITTPELRAEVVHACRAVAAADGTTDASESAWLAAVAAALR